MIQISKIKLTDIRSIELLEINFDSSSPSLLIAGNNGSGKTTILRSIAMGLCDEASAAALLRDLPGEFIRKSSIKKRAIIDIYFKTARKHYRIKTIVKSSKDFENVKQELFEKVSTKYIKIKMGNENKFPWHNIFITAYGSGARTEGTGNYQYYFGADSVYTLFKYDYALQNPELAIRRMIEIGRKKGGESEKIKYFSGEEVWKEIRDLLAGILDIPANHIYLEDNGLFIKIKSQLIDFGSMGDGFKATATWLLDLLSWGMLYKNWKKFEDFRGVVLMDELEQHLHPDWQLKIINNLIGAFPKIQFIIATHSPLIISGALKVPVLPLNSLKLANRNVEGWLAEDVYREIMGLESSRSNRIQEQIRKLDAYQTKKIRNTIKNYEINEMRKIKDELGEILPSEDPLSIITKLKSLKRFVESKNKK